MRKYWYTILLTISLSGAAAARMIPDSVAEAVAAEIIDLGTDIQMTAEAYACAGQEESENGSSVTEYNENENNAGNPAVSEPAEHQGQNTDIPAEAETSAADTLPADGSVSAPETNASAADGSGTASAEAPDSGSSPAVTESSAQEPLSLPENPDFTNVLFIGDSRTAGLSEYGDLGQAEVFADSGMSVFNLFDSRVKTKRGGRQTLQELLSQNQFQTIYLMLGINELGYEYSSIIKKYQSVVETIQSLQPEAVLVLQANLHVTGKKSSSSSTYNNEKLNRLNSGIQAIAEEHSCFYLDVNPVFDDENGNLRADYSTDGSHILGKYYFVWVDWLKEAS